MRFKSLIIKDESYLYENLVSSKCVDFLPNINPKSAVEMDILKRWQLHFESQGIPYYVSSLGPERWALFKEQRCEY